LSGIRNFITGRISLRETGAMGPPGAIRPPLYFKNRVLISFKVGCCHLLEERISCIAKMYKNNLNKDIAMKIFVFNIRLL
jgi:hypothetical protein